MSADLTALEQQINSFQGPTRQAALEALVDRASRDESLCRPVRDWFNLHCHSFYSYNAAGLSPSGIVWMAKKLGLRMVGLVDFDVLDGVDEFHAAGRLLGVKTIAGMETRAFVAPFAEREINSPGEPGITYHMGCGFVSSTIASGEAQAVAADLAARSRRRNLDLLAAVNRFLDPVVLDYEADVLPLTPAGNATERHICEAYQRKAEQVFSDRGERVAFWSAKLGTDTAAMVDDDAKLQGLIRSKTMKQGGVGYQKPDAHSFPPVASINAFARQLGALPMQTWLDGTTAGEQAIDELMDLMAADGVCALNIVPDRNWNIADAAVKARKVAELERVVAKADERGWPVCVGTELNAPGLKLVDDFDAPELAPVVASFRRGADILFGHSVAVAQGKPGYRDADFATITERNDHFAALGRDTAVLPTITAVG